MERRKKKWRRGAGIASTLTLLAGSIAMFVALSGPAAAVNNNPAGNPTSPAVSYESDCVGSGAAAGQVAPFVTSAVINTSTDTALPAGATFGAGGNVSQTVIGPIFAALKQALGAGATTTGLNVTETFGSTDGHATGTYAYTHSFAAVPIVGTQVTGVTYAAASSTLNGNFSTAAVGQSVAGASGGGIPAGSVITAITGTTSATINGVTTAADSTGETVGTGAAITFSDSVFSTGAAFTTAGTDGQTAGIGLVSSSSFDLTTNVVPLTFGGSPGVGTTNCLVTGYDAASNPGPAQTGATGPVLPPGQTTALVSASPLVVEPGAYVNLVQSPPVATSGTVNLGVGGTKTVTLATAPNDPGDPVASCTVGAPSDARLSVTPTANICEVTLTDSGSGPAIVTFTFTATSQSGKVSAPATETVSIGTPPVDQPIQADVLPGQLVLSCSAPGVAGYPALQCPIINLPSVTLNGTEQTATAAANTIYVSDNRGDPTVGWTLTTFMVPTSATIQPNATCNGLADAAVFCNSSVGSNAANSNGQIAASNLSISAPNCAVFAGNLNPSPTAGAGGAYGGSPIELCSAVAGQSGGTFTMDASFTLTIPASTYAGTYFGTVEYLVS
jgi:hypothetical protein